ncbi:MAG: murein biosynthesis integral membrane protein MurJ [Candidatus Nanopelagicaceae bacterium]
MSDGLIKSTLVMALGTLFSRITGFIRNIVIVALLGTALLGDAYNVGNTMPNIVYNLIIGGALTAVFLPQIVRALKDEDGGSAFISKLVTLVMTTLLLITTIAIILAPILIKIYAPTFDGREAEITLIFMLFCLPQILFYGLFALLGQIANSRGSFAPMMWAPIVNNLVVITIFTIFLLQNSNLRAETITDGQVQTLAFATTLGIVAQSLVLIPVIRKFHIGITMDFKWRGFGLRKSIRLAGWTLIYALITQVGFLITVNLTTRISKEASLLGIEEGLGLTPYQNAYLIFLLPHSIFTIAVTTAILPSLSRFVQDGAIDHVRSNLTRAIRLVGIVVIPSTFFFLFFGEAIGRAIFFGVPKQDAEFIGTLLSLFSLALIPLALNTIFIRTLNAFENTKYQALSNLVINLIAVVISLIAFNVLPVESKTLGIVLAFTISYIVGVFVTYRTVKPYLQRLEHRPYLNLYLKLAALSATILGLLAIMGPFFFEDQLESRIGNSLYLLAVLLITSFAYIKIAKRLGVSEVSEAVQLIFKKGR